MSLRRNKHRLDGAKIKHSKTLQQGTKKTTSGKVALTGYKVRNIQYEHSSEYCFVFCLVLLYICIHV